MARERDYSGENFLKDHPEIGVSELDVAVLERIQKLYGCLWDYDFQWIKECEAKGLVSKADSERVEAYAERRVNSWYTMHLAINLSREHPDEFTAFAAKVLLGVVNKEDWQ